MTQFGIIEDKGSWSKSLKKDGIDFEQGGQCAGKFCAVASTSQIVHHPIMDFVGQWEFFESFHESGMPDCVECL